MKKDIVEQFNENIVEFMEFAAYYIDEVCWRNVYIMNSSNRMKARINAVVRDLDSVIKNND